MQSSPGEDPLAQFLRVERIWLASIGDILNWILLSAGITSEIQGGREE